MTSVLHQHDIGYERRNIIYILVDLFDPKKIYIVVDDVIKKI